MIEPILVWTVIYIFLGFVFWEWVEYGKRDEPKSWGYQLVLAVIWLPIFILVAYESVRDWLKEDGGSE